MLTYCQQFAVENSNRSYFSSSEKKHVSSLNQLHISMHQNLLQTKRQARNLPFVVQSQFGRSATEFLYCPWPLHIRPSSAWTDPTYLLDLFTLHLLYNGCAADASPAPPARLSKQIIKTLLRFDERFLSTKQPPIGKHVSHQWLQRVSYFYYHTNFTTTSYYC